MLFDILLIEVLRCIASPRDIQTLARVSWKFHGVMLDSQTWSNQIIHLTRLGWVCCCGPADTTNLETHFFDVIISLLKNRFKSTWSCSVFLGCLWRFQMHPRFAPCLNRHYTLFHPSCLSTFFSCVGSFTTMVDVLLGWCLSTLWDGYMICKYDVLTRKIVYLQDARELLHSRIGVLLWMREFQ